MTFSIVAWLPETGELGVGVATCKPAVGGRVPFVRAGAGAVASQAVSNPWLGVAALDALGHALPAESALRAALAIDPAPHLRQLHLVAGNTLVGPAVLTEMAAAYRAADGDLAARLLAALEAGDAAGGDRRGRQSAALAVVRGDPFPYVDVRVDDAPRPLPELRRILALY